MEFIKNSIVKIWEGFLQNIGVLITAFVISGGYLIAINKLKEFQALVRSIPSDYFLTPLILLLVVFAVLVKINGTQQQQLSKLKQEPEKDEKDARLVTHLGVWWKIYSKSEYIEDFPYCACCDPKLKLVQTAWHPDEIFKCSKTDTEYKLYDRVPRERQKVLASLYNGYFRIFPTQCRKAYMAELRRIRELHPDMPESEITKTLFEIDDLSFLSDKDQQEITGKYSDPIQALLFVERNFDSYRKQFKERKANEKSEKQV